MKRIIYRVDDRFIHGQVIEGWINYYNIPNIILVNDRIASDMCQKLIYESIMPIGKRLLVTSVSDFLIKQPYKKIKKGCVLIIVGSISDMYAIKDIPDCDSYINIGCITSGDRTISITDTVFIDEYQLSLLKEMSKNHDIFVHKLPWDMPVNIKGFNMNIDE